MSAVCNGGQPLTRSYLQSSQPKPHELPVKKRKLESTQESAPALVLPTKVEEGWKRARSRREERGRVRTRAHAAAASLACQHLLVGESSFLEQNRVTAATVQRYRATLNEFLAFSKNVDGRAEAVGKVGRFCGGNAGTPLLSRLRTRSRRLFDGSCQVRRVDSKFLISLPCRGGL